MGVLIQIFSCRNGFPASFMYSSKVDTDTCRKFFTTVKEIGKIQKSRIFMTDDYPAYYNAWCQVFEAPDHRLLCSWHVIRNWTKNLMNVSDIDTRKKIKADLINIQRELDENQFNRKQQFFLEKYSTKSCEQFLNYYSSNYKNRAEQWASCYRKNLGINTNMYLENLHRNIKHVFMDGKKHRRMDHSISTLMKLIYHMQYERIIRKTKGYVPKRLFEIRNTHKTATESSFVATEASENSWAIVSESKNGTNLYSVEIHPEIECDCVLSCDICRICANQASCDCFDYAIKGNLCKHIHYALIERSKTSPGGFLGVVQEQDTEQSDMSFAGDLNQEDHSFFRMISNEKRESDIDIEKNEIIAFFTNLVRTRCHSHEDLQSVWKYIKPIESTLQASKKLRTENLVSISTNRSKKLLTPQKRFTKLRKRRIIATEKSSSNLDEEIFLNKK